MVLSTSLLMVLLLFTPSQAVTITVDTTIPEYILEDHLNLTGTAGGSTFHWTEENATVFNNGVLTGVIIDDDALLLNNSLDIQIQNSGNAVFTGGVVGAWDRNLVHYFDVIKHNDWYYMVYSAGGSSLMDTRHLGMAKSSDGITWTRYTNNPILRSRVNSYDYTNLIVPSMLYHNSTWHIWYGGNKGNTNPSQLQNINICYANSTTGTTFSKYSSNPVMKNSATNTDWDGIAIQPHEVYVENGTYYMYYVGTGKGWGGEGALGLATSTDGITWSEDASNPIVTRGPASWYNKRANYGTMEISNGTYRMWTSGNRNPWKVGWMTSDNGVDWTDSGGPVISPKAGTIYSSGIETPRLIDEGDHYKLFALCISGGTQSIGLFNATPKDLKGSYVSKAYDAGGVVPVTGVDWNTNVSAGGQVDLHMRWANSTNAWTNWKRIDSGAMMKNVTARYYQYKAQLRVEKDWMWARFVNFTISFQSPLDRVELSVDGGPWTSTNGSASDWFKNVSLHDGLNNIRIQAYDKAGRTTVRLVPIKCDLFPPTGNISIEGGKSIHTSTLVSLDIGANDTHGPLEMMLSEREDMTGASWVPYEDWTTLLLSGSPHGPVTVYIRLKDPAGRISEVYNDTIIIDMLPPTGTLLIDADATYTNRTDVRLNLTYDDLTGVVAMMASNDHTFAGASWMDPAQGLDWSLDPVDGVKEVHVLLQDAAGWTTHLTDSIILDSTPPVATLIIGDDVPYTISRDVTLDITLDDRNPLSVKLGNGGDPWSAGWLNLHSPTQQEWQLSLGADGQREVRMLVRDDAGNQIIISDTIVLDRTPPEATLTLEGGARFTAARLITAHLSTTDTTSGLDGMRVSNLPDLSDAAEQWIRETFEWLLTDGDGRKDVYVQITDMAGLSTTVSTTIFLDTAPPEGTFLIDDGTEWALDTTVVLSLSFHDSLSLYQLQVSSEANFLDAVWRPYTTSLEWELESREGMHDVYLMVYDEAGNSVISSGSIMLDLVDPTSDIVVEEDAEAVLDRTIDFTWSAQDSQGLAGYAYSLGPIDETTEWTPIQDAYWVHDDQGSLTFEGVVTAPELVTVRLWVRDLAGRIATASGPVWFVPERPTGDVTLGDGSGWSNTTEVAISVASTGIIPATHYRASTTEGDLDKVEWVPIDEEATVILEGSGGSKTVHIALLGPHNVTSLPFTGETVLDLLPPIVAAVTDPPERTEDERIDLSLLVSDDLDDVPEVRWRLNGGEWLDHADPLGIRLKEGTNLIEVEAEDEAGNVGTARYQVVRETTISVSAISWLVIIVIVAVVVSVGLWYWNKSRDTDQ